MPADTPRRSPRCREEGMVAQTCAFLTLAGEKLPIEANLNAHTGIRGFENAVLAELPYLGCSSTLGCELQFVQIDNHQLLADPIQSKLRANCCYYVIARPCFVETARKGQLKGEAKAIRVPRGRNDKIPPQAFSFHTEVRHVLVEPGMRIVGEAAWRSCRQLQVVHLPDTVVSLLHGAFSRCRALRVVFAPGCQHFGAKVFEECCSLTQIGVTQCPDNILAPQAQLRPRVFQGRTALQRLDLGKEGQGPTYPNRSLPDCCFLEAGIVALYLSSEFNRIGVAACTSCQQRSGVASPHCWSLMLPTSARVAQEVYEPLIGIQYPMLCSRLGDTWQIGTTSIREDHLIASGLRFIQWRHASPNIDARKEPKNNPTVKVYQHLEDELTRAGAGNEGILALTTTREAAQNLRNYFEIAWKTANAETAVKVAGATAKHCIVIHGESTLLSGEGRNLDYDQECFTRANVAYSRATNLTILACPLNMQGMPGALQVLAALLHGVQSIDAYDDKEPVIRGSLDLTPIQVEKATAVRPL